MKCVFAARMACTLVLAALLSSALPAQDMPQPAMQLARFDRLLGEWEGSGMATMAPGAPQGPWTATVTYEKVLGGHFIMDTTIVNVGPPGSPRMEFRGYLGWDRENSRYMMHACGNSGESHSGEFGWVDEDTFVTPSAGWTEGQLVATREIIHITKSGFDIQIDAAMGASPFTTTVKGSFKRKRLSPASLASKERGERIAGLLDKGTPGMTPVAEKMGTLSKLLGSWKVKGSVIEEVGGEKIPILGTETLSKVFGGHAVMARVIAEPMPNGFSYESHAFFTWNQHLKRFDSFHLTNTGESGTAAGWWLTPDHFVSTSAALARGKPTVMRMSFTINKDGSMVGSADALVGGAAPLRTFEATYTRK